MEAQKIKIVLIAAFLIVLAGVFICKCSKPEVKPEVSNSDTLFLSQWRKEKLEKQKLIEKYEYQIQELLMTRDSLLAKVNEKKQAVAAYRFKEKSLQEQLKQVVIKADITDSQKNNISPIIDSLVIASNKGDTACDETIKNLESAVANRDSVIELHTEVENSLKAIQVGQELKDQFITDQLNSSLKAQRKIARHNKLLSGALLILTGITGSLIIIQSIKKQ